MTISQFRRALNELREEAAKKPNILQQESLKEHSEWLKATMQKYNDAGLFSDDHTKINIICDEDVSVHLMNRWHGRHSLTLKDKIQLYQDIGIFS